MEHVPLLVPLLQALTDRPNSLSAVLICQISDSMRDIRCMTTLSFNEEDKKRLRIIERVIAILRSNDENLKF